MEGVSLFSLLHTLTSPSPPPLHPPGSKKMEHKGNSWHENCFTCNRCQQPIGTRCFVQKDVNNYCLPCYEKQFAQQCVHCKKVIHIHSCQHSRNSITNKCLSADATDSVLTNEHPPDNNKIDILFERHLSQWPIIFMNHGFSLRRPSGSFKLFLLLNNHRYRWKCIWHEAAR